MMRVPTPPSRGSVSYAIRERMRQEPGHFEDQELDLVYVAKRLKEALRLEQVFTETIGSSRAKASALPSPSSTSR